MVFLPRQAAVRDDRRPQVRRRGRAGEATIRALDRRAETIPRHRLHGLAAEHVPLDDVVCDAVEALQRLDADEFPRAFEDESDPRVVLALVQHAEVFAEGELGHDVWIVVSRSSLGVDGHREGV